jgi:hypothetical protein
MRVRSVAHLIAVAAALWPATLLAPSGNIALLPF